VPAAACVVCTNVNCPLGPAWAVDAYGRLFLLDISSAVPEPGSIGLLALGGVTLLGRRRRA
jgi:hypothetical protein